MSKARSPILWFALGSIASLSLVFAMGAENATKQPPRYFPRYSVSYVYPGLLITDNDTNRLYILCE